MRRRFIAPLCPEHRDLLDHQRVINARDPLTVGRWRPTKIGEGAASHAKRGLRDAPLQILQPIVLGRLELMGLHALLDQRDEGREQLAVQPVAVEIARRRV
jgi:hypothetical protein